MIFEIFLYIGLVAAVASDFFLGLTLVDHAAIIASLLPALPKQGSGGPVLR